MNTTGAVCPDEVAAVFRHIEQYRTTSPSENREARGDVQRFQV